MTTLLLPDLDCAYAPPAPPPGGGGRRRGRRLRRPVWGVAPIATDPEAWASGPPRRRLSRAATMTGVMGLAWVGSSALPGPILPAPDALDTAVDRAVAADPDDAPVASPVRVQEGTGVDLLDSVDDGLRAARVGAAEAAPTPSAERATETEAADEAPWYRNVIARYGDVEIVQPSEHVEMVGFHEGGTRASDVTPAATPDEDLGEQPVVSERRDDPLPTMVLPGRDRGTGSASAIDIAMPEDREVHAPITGTVTAANEYTLYGKHPDTIITIQPDGHPEVELEVLHVVDAQVQVGDRVEAGRTVLARGANLLPFGSQIDRFVEGDGPALPHVHLEVQRVG